VERQRLLTEAATRYERLLKDFPAESDICAQALRELGSIRALQGNTNEAVKLYTAVGDKYSDREWEVLMAWKGAADLLWDGNRHEDARKFYARIVERFGSNSASQVVQAVVRGSKARLAK
jgi:TolA-binding protein